MIGRRRLLFHLPAFSIPHHYYMYCMDSFIYSPVLPFTFLRATYHTTIITPTLIPPCALPYYRCDMDDAPHTTRYLPPLPHTLFMQPLHPHHTARPITLPAPCHATHASCLLWLCGWCPLPPSSFRLRLCTATSPTLSCLLCVPFKPYPHLCSSCVPSTHPPRRFMNYAYVYKTFSYKIVKYYLWFGRLTWTGFQWLHLGMGVGQHDHILDSEGVWAVQLLPHSLGDKPCPDRRHIHLQQGLHPGMGKDVLWVGDEQNDKQMKTAQPPSMERGTTLVRILPTPAAPRAGHGYQTPVCSYPLTSSAAWFNSRHLLARRDNDVRSDARTLLLFAATGVTLTPGHPSAAGCLISLVF